MKKDYKRFPIILDNKTTLVIHVFERNDNIGDMWMHDNESYQIESYDGQIKAAEQLITQLEDNWTPLFLEALIETAFKELKEHEKECKADFTSELLKKLNNVK